MPNKRSKNALLRMLAIQTDYRAAKREGISDVHIYRKVIEPRYRISEGYFRRVLTRNVKRELSELGAAFGTPEKDACPE